MRITGGSARGISLKTLPVKTLRPATDRMREAVFSSLGKAVEEKSVLDLFAGSGAYGLEAISRGAGPVTFVERSFQQFACLKSNLTAVLRSLDRDSSNKHACRANVFTWRPPKTVSFDWIFADPPYALLPQQAPALFTRSRAWLKPAESSLLILEAPGDFDFVPTDWHCLRCLGKPGRRSEPTVFIYALNHG